MSLVRRLFGGKEQYDALVQGMGSNGSFYEPFYEQARLQIPMDSQTLKTGSHEFTFVALTDFKSLIDRSSHCPLCVRAYGTSIVQYADRPYHTPQVIYADDGKIFVNKVLLFPGRNWRDVVLPTFDKVLELFKDAVQQGENIDGQERIRMREQCNGGEEHIRMRQ